MSRARAAGTALGKSIVEIAQLMYQENTKKNFLDGLLEEIKPALQRSLDREKRALADRKDKVSE